MMRDPHRDPVPIGEDDLQAWLDDRLPAARLRAVEAWLAANPDAAERYRRMASQRNVLRKALRARHDEPIPSRLRVLTIQARQRQVRRQGWQRVAAVCAWVMLGTGLGWIGRSVFPTTLSGLTPTTRVAAMRAVVAEAIAAHHVFAADARRPVEVAAQQEAALVRWLSNRLARPLTAPDLAPLGFRLMGGRLLPGAGGDPAAQLMYENVDGVRLTLYFRADHISDNETAFRYTDDVQQRVAAFWWVDQGVGYAVSAGDTDRSALLRVAELVHQQLSAPTPDRHPDRGL